MTLSIPTVSRSDKEVAVLLTSVLCVSACTILYELLISTASSYFLGSSVLHFSLTIGFFMFFLGVGSFLSKYVTHRLLDTFVVVEIGIGVIGGFSALLLFAAYSATEWYYLTAFLLIASLSTLAGLEIPIVTRIVREYQSLKDALAHILSFDYIGALVSSILFPVMLLPYLGLIRTACVVGILNLVIAFVVARMFRDKLLSARAYAIACVVGVVSLIGAFLYSTSISGFLEQFIYDDEIVLSAQSPYQRIVVTKHSDDTRLYLNGELQFSTVDEYRYHEALVHIPMAIARNRSSVLVLGGGDGLVVRELLKYPEVERIVLVDIDPQVTKLASISPLFLSVNQGSLSDQRVHVVNADAWNFIKDSSEIFSVIIADLPDPNDFALGKLYSKEFYSLLKQRMARDGVFVTQSSSPYFAREAFWCINKTLESVFPNVFGFSVWVPTFGQWGFNFATALDFEVDRISVAVPTRFLNSAMVSNLFDFDRDTDRVRVEENRLDNQALVRYYETNWREIQ